MTWKNYLKRSTPLLCLIALVVGCFGLLPAARAVSPAPDGCYPGFTTAEGCNALHSLTTGAGNTGLGWDSLASNTNGSYNTGVGAGTLVLNNADSNTAVGAAALLLNTTGTENTATGTDALVHNDNGGFNTAVGAFALFNNIGGSVNTAVGRHALFTNNTGNSNVAVGVSALEANTSGFENAALGGAALLSNMGGHDNIAVGQAALSNNTSGNNNIGIGFFGGLAVTTSSNVIAIGTQGQDMSNSCFIGQIFGATVPGASNVVIDANNRLGTLTSSKRFKEDIKPMDKASEALYALEPVSFHYKKEIDPVHTSQLGLVAESVDKVNPDLVVRDKEGKPYSVRYDQVNAMLLNEFLKEHRKVEEQQAAITQLKFVVAQQQREFQAAIAEQRKEMQAHLKQQDTEIQRVTDEVGLSKPAPHIVAGNQ
jgi:trimeric autotransporter adhesin